MEGAAPTGTAAAAAPTPAAAAARLASALSTVDSLGTTTTGTTTTSSFEACSLVSLPPAKTSRPSKAAAAACAKGVSAGRRRAATATTAPSADESDGEEEEELEESEESEPFELLLQYTLMVLEHPGAITPEAASTETRPGALVLICFFVDRFFLERKARRELAGESSVERRTTSVGRGSMWFLDRLGRILRPYSRDCCQKRLFSLR